MKSYTDLEQSKKLAEILPFESADMFYRTDGSVKLMWEHLKNIPVTTPCWSLAALLSVLPTLNDRNAILCKDIRCDKWHVCYHSTATLSIIDTERYDNAVNACYEMILKLNEQKLL